MTVTATPSRPAARRRRATRSWLLAVTSLLVATVGCGDDGDTSIDVSDGDGAAVSGDEEVPVLRAVAGVEEYRFDIPDTVPAGPMRLTLANRGQEPHHAQVFRLDDDTTIDDLDAAVARGEPAALLDVGSFLGGTGLVSPGQESRADAVVELEPGRYALLCFVPDPRGVPHVAHGMMRPFEVTASDDPASLPPADAEVALADYRFELPETIDGDAMLAVTNTATSEAHEMVVARPDDGVTVTDVVEALDHRGPLPAVGLGGMQAILPEASLRLQLDLEPGRYVVLCAVTSPDGTPHYHAGMIQEITVT